MAVPGLAPALEWPGQAPAKFTDPIHGKPIQRRIVETACREGDSINPARQGLGRYFTDADGLRPVETKKILGQRPSDVYEWRPGRRSLSEPGATHYDKPEGLKLVEPAAPVVFSIRERRHFRQVASKEEFYDRPVGPKLVVRENGLLASEQIAQEIDVSNECQRKQRVSDMLTKRNGIRCKSLGDKNYRHPEYEPRFHHAGGLVVGATFHRGSFAKTEARNATSIKIDDGPRRTVVSYEEKQRDRERREDMMEVHNLTKPLESAGGDILSWEAYALKSCATSNYEDLDSEDEAPQ